MNIGDLNNKIVICDEIIKNKLLQECSGNLTNIKFLNMKEIIKHYYFDYNEKAIYYLMHNYNLNYDIACTYLENMYYVNNVKYNNEKLDNLVKLKEELINNNLLIYDELFINMIKNRDVIVYKLDLNNFEENLIIELEKYTRVSYIDKKYNNYKHDVIKFNTIDEEVEFVAYSIAHLLDNNIDINMIKLANVKDDYKPVVKRIFGLYNIPINLDEKKSIYGTFIGKLFIDNYDSDISKTFLLLDKYKDTDIYNSLIKICNKYRWCDDYLDVKDMIIYDIKHTYIKNKLYDKEIKIVDYKDNSIKDEYVFLVNFNQGSIPAIYKDEDYLDDNLKKIVGLEETNKKNVKEKEITINSINNIKNLTITYMEKTPKEKFYPSNLCDIYETKTCPIDYKISYSKINNEIKLGNYYDKLIKYGDKDHNLALFNSNYNIPYLTYNNKFSGIDKSNLIKYLDNKLTLSYTSLSSYYECAFKYYLNSILKLNIYEDNFSTIIGTIFHYVLEKGVVEGINVKEKIEECLSINYKDKVFSNMELFFINKLDKDITFVLEAIKKHMKFCELKNIETEKSIDVYLNSNLEVKFTGKIDKILSSNTNDNTFLAIIDYKTGNPSIDLSYVPYGLHMQLPIYMFLVSNANYKNIKIAGIYLQKVLPKIEKIEYGKDIDKIKLDNLKLEGYSNKDGEILKKLDSTYEDSLFIKSMKTKNDGDFYSYAKVLSDDEMNTLVNIAKEKIEQCINDISEARFDINPKVDEDNNIGCLYCKYKDICFMKKKDEIEIKKDKDLEYLGGDNNV